MFARRSCRERRRLVLRGGVGAAGYVAELLEERRMLALTVPVLNSLPGAPATLYLNFRGHAAFDWNNGTQYHPHGPLGNNDPIPPFDWDGNTASFSKAELTAIQQIFSLIAEKYSPFKINVTTVDPGNRNDGQSAEVILGGSPRDWLQPDPVAKPTPNSGVSAIGGFASPDLPNVGFLFANFYPNSTYFVANNAAHEAGHGFGLLHERYVLNPPPKDNSNYPEYFPGDGNEAPIMGDAANQSTARGIWWKTNDYPGQNSGDGIQDELDALAGFNGPLSYRADDFPSNNPGTLSIDGSGQVQSVNGMIVGKDDVDSFRFVPPTSSATFAISNVRTYLDGSGAAISAMPNQGMLAPDVTITDGSGNVIPSSINDTNTSATITCNFLTPGRSYFVNVMGQGKYGDIGQYTVSGQMHGLFATYSAISRTVTVGGLTGDNVVNIRVNRNGVGDPGLLDVSDSVNGGGTGHQTFPMAGIDHVNIFLGSGSDTVSIDPLAQWFTGNPGPDVYLNLAGGNNTLKLTAVDPANVGNTTFNVNDNRHITFMTTPVTLDNVQRVELHGASLYNNNFFVHSWEFGPRLYVYGSGGQKDNLTIDGVIADNVGSLITFNGAATDGGVDLGTATLTIDDSANLGGILNGGGENGGYVPKTFSISELGVFSNAAGGVREFDLANVTNINIYLGRGIALGEGPSVFVDGELKGQNISVYGNANDISTNSYFVGLTDPHGFPELSSPFSDAILGDVWFYGNGGGNNLTIDDRDHATAGNYTLFGNFLHSNSGGGTVHWDGVNFPEVDFYGSNAGSSMTANGFDSAIPVHLFGGTSASDVLTIDDRSMANRRPNRFDLYKDKVTRFFADSPTFESTYYTGYEALNGYLNVQENTANVYSVPALPAGQQVTLYGSASDDTFTVYPRDAAGNPTLLGNLGIIGGAGTDLLNLSDALATTGTTWTVSNPFGATTQDFSLTGSALMGALNDVESIGLYASAGDDTFNVNTYKAGNGFALYAGAGDDTLNFGNNSLVNNVTSISAFTFDGEAGSDTFNVLSSGDGSGTYTRGTFAPGIGLTSFVNQLGNYSITLADQRTESIQIYPGQTGPAVNVNAVLPGTTTAVHFNSPASPGVLRVGSSSNTLTGIQGAIVFDGGASGSSIAVNDGADATGRIAHLTQTSLGAFPGDTLFPTGGSLTFNKIVAGFTPALTLTLGGGADTVYAQPNPTGTITITGGGPTAAPGDTINLALAAAQNYVLHGNAASGNVTSANLKTLTYSGFEGGPNVDAVAPAVAGADINLNGIPGAGAAPAALPGHALMAAPLPPNRQSLDIVFSEDVALPAGAAAIALANLTTGQDVPQGYVAVSYDPATRTAHFTFPGYANGVLPDGNYHGRLLAAGAADLFGNSLITDAPFDFFILAGDANHDRAVDFNDLVVLAQNYNTPAKTFAQGDFNYDGTVDFNDLVILAQRYNTTL
ncbi:MAG TPA: hypothetical protein VH475_00895, partial [Tepidisphaeraceae bacterium]